MRCSALLSSLLLALTTPSLSLADPLTSEPSHSLTLYTSPLPSGPLEQYARISYTYPSLNSTIDSRTTPSFLSSSSSSSSPLPPTTPVKFGFFTNNNHHDPDAWVGILTSASQFAADREKKIKLRVDAAGKVWSAAFFSEDAALAASTTTTKKTKKAKGKGKTAQEAETEERDTLLVEVINVNKGPLMQLNKPVVVNKEGKKEGEEEEKTFLQK